MLSRLDAKTIDIVDDDRIQPILQTHGTQRELQRGGLRRRRKAKELVVFRHLQDEELYPGRSWRHLRCGQHEYHNNHVLCHTAFEIQSAIGCPFDCTYCPYSSFMCLDVDVEGFVDRAVKLAMDRRGQSVFKLNNRTDTLGLEPEYGLAPHVVQRFAELSDKYLMLYSKGDLTDSIETLDHRGKTIACFTLTPDPIASVLEAGAPRPARRLQAIKRLSEAGFPIRIRLSPIVPFRGWQDAYRGLIAQLMDAAHPSLVTLWTLSMVDFEELTAIVPRDELDEEALEVAQAAAREMDGRKGAPFPPMLRAAIYREIAEQVRSLSPATEVSLCLETAEVWDAVGPLVVARYGRSFVCNCGPRAIPM